MGIPFQHTRNKLRQTARKLKGQLEPAYHLTRHVLGHVDKEVHTLKAIHSVVAPLIDLTAQGRILNDNLSRASSSYDTIRNHVANADKMGRAAVGIAGILNKHSVGIGL